MRRRSAPQRASGRPRRGAACSGGCARNAHDSHGCGAPMQPAVAAARRARDPLRAAQRDARSRRLHAGGRSLPLKLALAAGSGAALAAARRAPGSRRAGDGATRCVCRTTAASPDGAGPATGRAQSPLVSVREARIITAGARAACSAAECTRVNAQPRRQTRFRGQHARSTHHNPWSRCFCHVASPASRRSASSGSARPSRPSMFDAGPGSPSCAV